MRKTRFLRVRYFVWIIVPVTLYGVYAMVGLPHFIWSYEWTPRGTDSISDVAQRQYTRCTYIGPHGSMSQFPPDGKCGWLFFAKAGEHRQ